MVAKRLMPRYVLMAANCLLTIWGPLLVTKYVGVPYENTQWSKKRFAACVTVVFAVDIERARFETQFVITITNELYFAIRGSGLNMFMTTEYNSSNGESSCRRRFRL